MLIRCFCCATGKTLLTWQITDTQMDGSLTMTDTEDPSNPNQLVIDMRSDSDVQVNVNEIERVFIHYRVVLLDCRLRLMSLPKTGSFKSTVESVLIRTPGR